MKKIYLALLLTIIAAGSKAQFGISSGINLAKYSYSESDFATDRKSLLAFNIGLQYKKEMTEKAYLLPELSYSVKGTRIYHSYDIGFTGPMKHLNKLNYLQLSIPVIAALPVSDEIDFEIGAGPYIAYLINATQKEEEFDGSTTTAKFGSDAFKHMDCGLRITTGFRMSKALGLHLSYDWGFSDINPGPGDVSIKTRNFSVNIGWLFSASD